MLVVYAMQSLLHCWAEELHEHTGWNSHESWSVSPLHGEVPQVALVVGVARFQMHPLLASHVAGLVMAAQGLAKHMELP